MKEHGLVIEADGQTACVVLSKSANCANCNACCIGKDKNVITAVDNSIKAGKGDRVIVEVSDTQAMKSALLVFGLPIAALVLGVLVFNSLVQNFGLGSLSGVVAGTAGGIFLLLAFVGIHRYDRYLRAENRHNLRIVQILKV